MIPHTEANATRGMTVWPVSHIDIKRTGTVDIIVSCTSTRARLGLLRRSLPSLLEQTRTPDLLLVHLARSEFTDVSEALGLVPELAGVSHARVSLVDDVGPYTKLLPALDQAAHRDLIITVDDDVSYDRRLVAGLVETAREFRRAICCARARRIRRTVFGGFMNYDSWHPVETPTFATDLLPLGVGGVAYRRDLLDHDMLVDPAARHVAPTADDLWFRAASLLVGAPVRVDPRIGADSVEFVHTQGLVLANRGPLPSPQAGRTRSRTVRRVRSALGINETRNDTQWDAIRAYLRSCGRLLSTTGSRRLTSSRPVQPGD